MTGQRIIQPKKRDNENETEKEKKKDKRVFVDLSKEYEEDKELLELLEGRRKNE